MIYPQQHELVPMPPTGPPPPYPKPEYGALRPGAQRAGYEYILRDGTNDIEVLLSNPPHDETGNDLASARDIGSSATPTPPGAHPNSKHSMYPSQIFTSNTPDPCYASSRLVEGVN
jgi:hypothetical protein